MSPVVVVVILFVLLASLANSNIEEDQALCRPQHIHIAYGDSLDQIVILWATVGNCSTLLEFGPYPWNRFHREIGSSAEFWEQNVHGLHNLHRVKLTNLEMSTTYFYRPLSNNIGSGPFYFKTPRADLNWSPDFLVFGDLGVHTQTVPRLVEEALNGTYTALLHVGDFAYNLKDNDGQTGDQFMELIQPVAAFLPYMTCPGNHEIDSDTFTHYNHRFSMPMSPWPMSVKKMWYSFNVGPVHFVSYSTEVFFTLDGSLVSEQFNWLVDDLQKANAQRSERPWIIAFGHRPMYCSSRYGEDCTKNTSVIRAGLEDLFYHYGVDIVLQAHEHNYERLYPMYKGVVVADNYVNPQAPIQIISGAAGSLHGSGHFQKPPKPDWVAVRIEDHVLNSYGRMQVVNSSHVYWEQRSIHNHSVLDSVWIEQHHHSKFQVHSLSENISSQIKDQPSILTDLLEEDTKDEGLELKKQDITTRIAIGASFGAIVAILIIIAVFTKACRRRQYISVRRWEAVDLNYGKKLFTPGKDEDNDLEQDFEIDVPESNRHSKRLLNST